MTDSPVFTSPVVGYRTWRICGHLELSPLWMSHRAWVPGVNEAECEKDHRAPGSDCGCGLYAYHDLGAFFGVPRATNGPILGAVVGWGDMEIHADGWRAQYARIVALAPIGGRVVHLHALADRYGVPVVQARDLPLWAEREGQSLPRDALPPSPPSRVGERHGPFEVVDRSLAGASMWVVRCRCGHVQTTHQGRFNDLACEACEAWA